MKKFVSEFKEFVSRGNVIDMAVGIVMGTAFTKITNSLVADIIMPLIGVITGKVNLTALAWTIVAPDEAAGTPGLVLTYGSFLQAILDFLLIAFALFCVIKIINTTREKLEKKKEEEKAQEPPKPSNEELLLTEIRDLLKERK